MSRFWSRTVKALEPYVPGEQPRGTSLVKLNTNENPYGPSQFVLDAIKAEAEESLRLYPDPEATQLKEEIAQYYDLDTSNVFVGNGSDEVLAHIFKAYFAEKGGLCFPDISYSFYPVYCGLYDIEYEQTPLNSDFTIDLDAWHEKDHNLIFPNPNAPTGIAVPLDEIERLLKSNRDRLIVVDEAYVDFGAESAVACVSQYDNLIVTQTFSKSRSLAGMRAGFAIAHSELIDGLERVKNSFNSYPIDRLAIAGACAAIKDRTTFEKNCRAICDTRAYLERELQKLSFETLPSKANFVFTRHSELPARSIYEQLRSNNIIVRYFSKPGIDNFLRISIGTDAEANQLIETLKSIIID